jgi:hypothetical protein
MKKLAGTLFICNGNKYDYCYIQAAKCLLDFCDHVFILDAGSTDGTDKDLIWEFKENQKVTLIKCNHWEWEAMKGKEKLHWFTNKAIIEARLSGYEWNFNLQGDEIILEKSYDTILKAIQENEEGFMCKRVNLWKTPYHQLNVTHDRLPCSTEIVRLAKIKYDSYGDAESLAVDNVSMKYLNDIIIYHYGFVRDKYIMKDKVINMQEQVFGVDHDKKLDGTDQFEPDRWFNPETDLKIIDYPHPKIMQDWIKNRP